MIDSDYCRQMAEYNIWMNERVYSVCGDLADDERKKDRGAFFGSIHSTLNHLMFADQAFMSRFTGKPKEIPPLGVDLYDDFGQMQGDREALDRRILDWSQSLQPDWLRADYRFVSKVDGRTRTLPTWALVTQMFNHQTHHRGQLTTLLSQLGLDIGSTDIPFMPRYQQ